MTQIVNFKGQHGGAAKGCLIAAVIVLILVVGGGWFLWNKSMGVLSDELIAAVQDDPAVKEHLGELSEASMNLMATGKHPENQGKNAGGDNAVIVFDVTGAKGSGRIIASMNTKEAEGGDGKIFSSAYLKMGDKRYPLSLHGKPAAPLPAELEKAPAETPKDGATPEDDSGK